MRVKLRKIPFVVVVFSCSIIEFFYGTPIYLRRPSPYYTSFNIYLLIRFMTNRNFIHNFLCLCVCDLSLFPSSVSRLFFLCHSCIELDLTLESNLKYVLNHMIEMSNLLKLLDIFSLLLISLCLSSCLIRVPRFCYILLLTVHDMTIGQY